jgi:hypothetical protein
MYHSMLGGNLEHLRQRFEEIRSRRARGQIDDAFIVGIESGTFVEEMSDFDVGKQFITRFFRHFELNTTKIDPYFDSI